jgi:hypothetical protein
MVSKGLVRLSKRSGRGRISDVRKLLAILLRERRLVLGLSLR